MKGGSYVEDMGEGERSEGESVWTHGRGEK